jgi:hypothetical protein
MEFQQASLLAGFGAAWATVALVALIYYWLKRKAQPAKEAKEEKSDDNPKYVNTVKKKLKKEMDSTKLLSLQPANRAAAPGTNWTTEEVETDGVKSHQWKHTPPLKGDFEWKFFGSQLSVGDKTIWTGLPKKMHLLEITRDDIVYLDGTPKQIHPGELESLKRTIRDAEL